MDQQNFPIDQQQPLSGIVPLLIGHCLSCKVAEVFRTCAKPGQHGPDKEEPNVHWFMQDSTKHQADEWKCALYGTFRPTNKSNKWLRSIDRNW